LITSLSKLDVSSYESPPKPLLAVLGSGFGDTSVMEINKALGVKDQRLAAVLGCLHSNYFSCFCFKLVSILAIDLV